ncbi:MAG: hypothetical protein ACRD4R_13025 [Candidatus Acidiferrales bacterium]
MGLLYSILLSLLYGGTAAAVTGTGVFFEVSFGGFADDLLMLVVKRFLIQAADLSMWESLMLSVAIDELKKVVESAIDDQQDEDAQAKLEGNWARFSLGITPGVYGQFDLADAGLFWWSLDTLYTSDLTLSLAGVAGDAAVVL